MASIHPAHRRLPFGRRGATPAAKAQVEESVQERSYRLWAEHFATVAAAPDLTVFSTAALERAHCYASTMIARELQKGWDGDTSKVNRQLVASLEREVSHLRFVLSQRYAERDARYCASQAKRLEAAA